MLLVDVMHRLNSEYEIRFLLSAYIESLLSRHAQHRLPLGVAVLPLRDASDIEARFTELIGAQLTDLARSYCDTQGAIEREATEIFGAAVTRLHALGAQPLPEHGASGFWPKEVAMPQPAWQ
jgi:hypothetical protein